jgi:mRNA interferase RelE/StbE
MRGDEGSMIYDLAFKPAASRDLNRLDRPTFDRIVGKITQLREGLAGDVKKLTNFTPNYRLRVGDYRVLFNVADNKIIVWRVLHRRDAYR